MIFVAVVELLRERKWSVGCGGFEVKWFWGVGMELMIFNSIDVCVNFALEMCNVVTSNMLNNYVVADNQYKIISKKEG
jgi:hypothetical protein